MSPHALDRYYSILNGEARAKYLGLKEELVDVDLSGPTMDLWEAHRRAASGRSSRGAASRLSLKTEIARRMHMECTLCERKCGARRAEGEAGRCGVLEARVCSEFLHMGEEPDLVPSHTIFFAGCTFSCVFCQNWDISTRPRSGVVIAPGKMAARIEERAGKGARNVNWVGGDPTSNLLYVLETLGECEAGTPQVWNSNMYLSEESMALLDGVVDVYLTDFKYGNDRCALRLSDAPDYMRVITRNHSTARASAEVIVRHLVLPGHIECCTRPVLEWVSKNLAPVKVNVMAQYRPEHRAREFPELARPLGMAEFEEAMRIADDLCLDLTG